MGVMERRLCLKVAALASVDPRTVAKVYEGLRTLPALEQAIRDAAQELGLPQPPEPSEAQER